MSGVNRAITIPMSELTEQITFDIKITGMTAFKLRSWLGLKILRFGVWVIGCKIDLEVEHDTTT